MRKLQIIFFFLLAVLLAWAIYSAIPHFTAPAIAYRTRQAGATIEARATATSEAGTEAVPHVKPPRPTRTPGPTATPVAIPPPPDPVKINLMIAFGSLVVFVVISGLWINRGRQ